MARRRGSLSNDSLSGTARSDRLFGNYGNDTLDGGTGNDRLNGGRGNDLLNGGAGNDVIVSRSDAGETPIAQDINATNDPNGEVNAATRMIYPNQVGLPADDILTGGAGADQFRIEALVNAKLSILQKHADANGVIDYMAVTGENTLVHDHWVDSIGNDVITDFNKADGDKLSIVGHTVEVSQIEIKDADGDGAVDDTVLQLRSNQGAGGGAHNLDLLGTVTVLNNQLTANDFTVDAASHPGIVRNIAQVQEAINPTNPSLAAAPPPAPAPAPTPTPPPVVNPAPAPAPAPVAQNKGTVNDDSLVGTAGNDTLSGNYGNDTLAGGAGQDRLNGGRGNDQLIGGDGNDVVRSRSDAGETPIAQDINAANDPNGEVNGAARMIYPNQVGLPADDILTGGAGADQFQIETLVNAKLSILQKHADANGVIDYMAVTGENTLVHDHWVDSIGNDVITDFNKAEGDTLSIAGHTTEVNQIEIKDADGDGAADDTVLHLRSNQGAGGGAHNLDLLGTVTVLNNQLTANDFTIDAGQHFGIVKNIAQAQEAINPMNPTAAAPPPAPVPTPAPTPPPVVDPAPVDPPPPGPVAGPGPDPVVDPAPVVDPVPTPPPALGHNALAEMLAPPDGTEAGQAPTAGDDVVIYADGNDNGAGGKGNDLMIGLAGNDSMSGGFGDDSLDGGVGNDKLVGGRGDDLLSGSDGNDALAGDFGDDILVGGVGDDNLSGSRGTDALFGDGGVDALNGGSGDDLLMGGDGADSIDGGSGTDAVVLDGNFADYTIAVAGDGIQFTAANGDVDVVSHVEQFRFLGNGETYHLDNGALALTTDTADLDELLSDHFFEHLIEDGSGGGDADVIALDPAAPPASAPEAAPPIVPDVPVDVAVPVDMHTHDLMAA